MAVTIDHTTTMPTTNDLRHFGTKHALDDVTHMSCLWSVGRAPQHAWEQKAVFPSPPADACHLRLLVKCVRV